MTVLVPLPVYYMIYVVNGVLVFPGLPLRRRDQRFRLRAGQLDTMARTDLHSLRSHGISVVRTSR